MTSMALLLSAITQPSSLAVCLLMTESTDSGNGDSARKVVCGHRLMHLDISQIGVLDDMVDALHDRQEVGLCRDRI